MLERSVSPPHILIVVPTLGQRLEMLEQTLASIRSQDQPADIVVVTPPTAITARKLARAASAHLVDDPGSISAAVNRGWSHAGPQHRYVNWIGDDDLLTEGSLKTASDALDTNPAAVVAFGHCDYIDDEGRRLWTSSAGRLAPWLMTWGPNLLPQPGALFRLAAIRDVGYLDETLQFAMDLDLLLRLRRRGTFVNTRRTLASFRWHPESTTVANRSASLAESEAVKRRYLTPAKRRGAVLWEKPVRVATRIAAGRVTRIAVKAR